MRPHTGKENSKSLCR